MDLGFPGQGWIVEVVVALRGGPGTGWQQEGPGEEEKKQEKVKNRVKIS